MNIGSPLVTLKLWLNCIEPQPLQTYVRILHLVASRKVISQAMSKTLLMGSNDNHLMSVLFFVLFVEFAFKLGRRGDEAARFLRDFPS